MLETDAETNECDSSTDKAKKVSYNIFIPDKIHEKIEKILSYRKFFDNQRSTNAAFVLEAIKEKIKNDEQDPVKMAQLDKTVFIQYEQEIEDQILKFTDIMKKHKRRFSKKVWIQDAIIEKIDREEESIRKRLQDEKRLTTT